MNSRVQGRTIAGVVKAKARAAYDLYVASAINAALLHEAIGHGDCHEWFAHVRRNIDATLKKYSGRVSGGRRIVNKPGRSRVKLWTVETLATACDVETAQQAELIQAPDDRGFDAGICDDCGAALTGTPTADGYLNRRCDDCGTDKPCLPFDDAAAILSAETQAATTQTAFV